MSRHTLCNCPAGFSAAPERHAPDCPGRSGAGKPIPPAVAQFAVAALKVPEQRSLKIPGQRSVETYFGVNGELMVKVREYDGLAADHARLRDATSEVISNLGEWCCSLQTQEQVDSVTEQLDKLHAALKSPTEHPLQTCLRDNGGQIAQRASDRQAALQALAWLDQNRQRLHAPECSVHEPSARCSCGLHNVLTLLAAVKNGNAELFIAAAEAATENEAVFGDRNLIPSLEAERDRLTTDNGYMLMLIRDLVGGVDHRGWVVGIEVLRAARELLEERTQQLGQVIAQHSGCGYGIQVDQLTVRLYRGDKVIMVRGPLGAAHEKQGPAL